MRSSLQISEVDSAEPQVGSEFGRAAKRKEKGKREKELKFFEKGLELLDMSIASAANKMAQHPGIFRELARQPASTVSRML